MLTVGVNFQEKPQLHRNASGLHFPDIVSSFIFILWIHTGLQNPYGYVNSHICLRSLEVNSI